MIKSILSFSLLFLLYLVNVEANEKDIPFEELSKYYEFDEYAKQSIHSANLIYWTGQVVHGAGILLFILNDGLDMDNESLGIPSLVLIVAGIPLIGIGATKLAGITRDFGVTKNPHLVKAWIYYGATIASYGLTIHWINSHQINSVNDFFNLFIKAIIPVTISSGLHFSTLMKFHRSRKWSYGFLDQIALSGQLINHNGKKMFF